MVKQTRAVERFPQKKPCHFQKARKELAVPFSDTSEAELRQM